MPEENVTFKPGLGRILLAFVTAVQVLWDSYKVIPPHIRKAKNAYEFISDMLVYAEKQAKRTVDNARQKTADEWKLAGVPQEQIDKLLYEMVRVNLTDTKEKVEEPASTEAKNDGEKKEEPATVPLP